MKRRKVWRFALSLLLLLVLIVNSALAGLLPSAEELYGVTMPSGTFALGREPDEVTVTEEGEKQIWNGVGEEEYRKLDQYLGQWGCTAGEASFPETVLTVLVKKEDTAIVLEFDRDTQRLSLLYPQGTRPEMERHETLAEASGILPSAREIFTWMPSLSRALLREADDRSKLEDGSVQVVYNGVTEADLETWSIYIGEYGCTLENYSVINGLLMASLEKNGKKMSFSYDNHKETMTLLYPEGTTEEEADLKEEKRLLAEKLLPFRTMGNTVTFGRYEQDNNPDNGPEEIEWIVLDVQEEKTLLVSKYGLDVKPYNAEEIDITWEECSLREWLNHDFISSAFTAEEQKSILTTQVDNGDSQGISSWRTNGGHDTQDQMFLLSYAEAVHYLDVGYRSMKSRVSPTAFAKAQGAYISSEFQAENGDAAGCWWLRSPGSNQSSVANVITDGSFSDTEVSDADGCVRPAFWLKLPAVSELLKPSRETRVGDTVAFGRYEQDDYPDNGPEEIEWIVLDVQEGKALLLSKHILDARSFDTSRSNIWETSEIRAWLNGDFLNAAFSPEEQNAILMTVVDNSSEQGHKSPPDQGSTEDKVFLLSYREADEIYFSDAESRKCVPTDYAVSNGCFISDDYFVEDRPTSWWWLRSPYAYNSIIASAVDDAGWMVDDYVNYSYGARPAFWLNLESDLF